MGSPIDLFVVIFVVGIPYRFVCGYFCCWGPLDLFVVIFADGGPL
jgi:hypothetical protein